MVQLGREELDVWLGEPDDFVLAVLRDIHESDHEVQRWLNTPHPDLGARCPVDLLSAGRRHDVEVLLIREWNER
jgi:hypothetical protein